MDTSEQQPIKQWADDDKPREKLLAKGKSALSEAELLAILIGSGSRGESAVDLCKRILHRAENNLIELGKNSVADLMKFKGIGEAKAISIVAALELGRRRREVEALEKKKISSSNDIFELFHGDLSDLNLEEFWILLLNRANKVIKKVKISSGGISGTVADTRLIFKSGIDHLASAIILVHNHPSGNNKPSQTDITLTKKLVEVGKIMDITVLDHIIIAENRYFSFADEGII
ncbi:MAG: DNA repair protein RadC [Flavobacteriales bacterium]|nr:DNA repair protein RadC [Flavobacteriales bacterium]